MEEEEEEEEEEVRAYRWRWIECAWGALCVIVDKRSMSSTVLVRVHVYDDRYSVLLRTVNGEGRAG